MIFVISIALVFTELALFFRCSERLRRLIVDTKRIKRRAAND